MPTNKKSQAAIEFLTTYAWVILGILILIGSLAYFGILNPSKFLPDRCNIGSEIGCMQSVIKENGLQLRLINNVGSTIIVDTVSVIEGENTLCNVVSPLADPWQAGKTIDLPVVCDGFSTAGILADEKKKLGFEIIYHTPQGGTTFKKYVQGEVFATVQEGQVVSNVIFEDNFDAALDPAKWPTLTNVVANTDCGAVSNPNSLKFAGNAGSGNRFAETKEINIPAGKDVIIKFKIKAGVGSSGSCQVPANTEDLILEYSTGAATTELSRHDIGDSGVNSYSAFVLITKTVLSSSIVNNKIKFKWKQENHNTVDFDNWAIDDVEIS